MGRRLTLVLAVFMLSACEDKAAPDYNQCVTLAAQAHYAEAKYYCGQAVKADPSSASGKKAAKKLEEVEPLLQKAIAEEERAKAEVQAKAAAAKAIQDAADAKCTRWTTICTLGRHSDGSERTSGSQYFSTKSECEGIGPAMGGLKCDPCKCVSH